MINPFSHSNVSIKTLLNTTNKNLLLHFIFLLIIPYKNLAQQYYKGSWGDNENGTYNNPVLPADYRDPDVIKVGKDYYMITSTFWMSPGLTILHSSDLINWEYLTAAVPDISSINRKYSWSSMKYDDGIWAPCITYNTRTKLFYIHWGDNIMGFFVVKAKNIKGPWSKPKPVLLNGNPLGPAVDDCAVLWDDDGKGYFVYNEYGTDHSYKNYLHTLSADGESLLDKGVLIHENQDEYAKNQTGAEAYKLFKKDGYYYFWHNEIPPDGLRKLCMMRSTCMYGKLPDGENGNFSKPGKYEHGDYFIWGYRQPSQGNIVSTPDDKDWYLLTHLDKAEVEGAPICVVPMKWQNGWIVPSITQEGKTGATMDTEGMWKNIKKPLDGISKKVPATSDDFSNSTLGLQWLWNHQPRQDKWSLTERPGYLRLYAWETQLWWAAIDKINLAGNTIYQRYFRNKISTITSTIDISAMADGQNAGFILANYQKYTGIGVVQVGETKYLRYYESTIVGSNTDKYLAVKGNEIPADIKKIYLRSISNFEGFNRFYYSLDGETFFGFGEEYHMVASGHRGFYAGFFTYNSKQEKGYIDVDNFNYKMEN